MSVTFPFKEYPSSVFGKMRRPVAQVSFQHKIDKSWQPVTMLVDTGADYTLLPRFLASTLGVVLSRDCRVIHTSGVGGASRVYMLKKKIDVKIGNYTREVPVGFLASDDIPPLLGREKFLETFKVTLEKFSTTFE